MKHRPYTPSPGFVLVCSAFAVLAVFFFLLPHIALTLSYAPATLPPFPVSVDPRTKTIQGEERVAQGGTPLLAAAIGAVADGSAVLAAAIMSTKVYTDLSPLEPPHAVRIDPGMRKEQVAAMLDAALEWSPEQRATFLEHDIEEGMLYPSTYLFPASTTPAEAAELIRARFGERVEARYGSTTEAIVPIADALALAAIIEREAGTAEEMPVIAGVLWNRLFLDMRLQADSTLQYARGTARNGWWPVPRARDKFIKSPYNTYQNPGLPPGPIASPSVAAIYAALNPAQTDCLFFFHAKGAFYCSPTYEEHVKALKKIYGRGR